MIPLVAVYEQLTAQLEEEGRRRWVDEETALLMAVGSLLVKAGS